MRQHLLQWQWELYPDGHTRRLTLAVHTFTTPLFIAGTILLALSPLPFFGAGWHFAVAGLAFIASTVMLQGWTHKQENAKPVPFLGPFDFVSRFFVEQWVTFPRFVMSGKMFDAWRTSARSAGADKAR
ncbi:MAG TPA: hypothetical protein VH054_09880 [Polyangiaceae bacterium]|jgi:hypothetical protein|nr:hypothetical protein [Polyangiaceae bacterium]